MTRGHQEQVGTKLNVNPDYSSRESRRQNQALRWKTVSMESGRRLDLAEKNPQLNGKAQNVPGTLKENLGEEKD
jgi:hypothetical protein